MWELNRVGFSGHETFPFRAGWLKKGFEAARHSPKAFSNQDSAMTRLGVGKNMVRSIRHWCLATRLLEESAGESGRGVYPTNFGRQLFGKLDPYLEETGTLWLLHWQLATNSERATTWYAVFSGWFQSEFTKDELLNFLKSRLGDRGQGGIADSTLRRDVDCFVRTYVPARTTTTLFLEDTLDCPLSELDIVHELSDRKTYTFQRGNNPSLPDLILGFIILDYWIRNAAERETLSFEDLMYKPGAPGRVLRFEENALTERLEQMEAVTQGVFSFTNSGGIRQLLRGRRQISDPTLLLEEYYCPGRKG